MFNQNIILAGKPMYQIDFLAHKNDLNFGRDETLSKRINSRIDGLINPLTPVPAVTGRAKTHPQFPVPAVTGRKKAHEDKCLSYPP